MAQMQTDGIEEAIRQLNKADLFTDENVKAMLTVGATVMLEAVKAGFVAAGHNNGKAGRTCQTSRHIKRRTAVRKNKYGDPYMVVTVAGTDSRGQRYATKAFVLNYGRRTGGRITADYYWSAAKNNAWPRVNAAMSDKAAEIINK